MPIGPTFRFPCCGWIYGVLACPISLVTGWEDRITASGANIPAQLNLFVRGELVGKVFGARPSSLREGLCTFKG